MNNTFSKTQPSRSRTSSLRKTAIFLQGALLWNLSVLAADDGACGQSELTNEEIQACVTNNADCESLGALTNKIEVLDRFRSRADTPANKGDRLRPSLVYFEVVSPTAVRFRGRGYERLFLFEIDGRSVRTTFRCVKNNTKLLGPGRYVLQGFRAANLIPFGKMRLVIEPVNLRSRISAGKNGAIFSPADQERNAKKEGEPRKLIKYSTRIGLVVGVLIFLWALG